MLNFPDLLDKFLSEEIDASELDHFLLIAGDPVNLETVRRVLGEKLQTRSFSGLSSAESVDENFRRMLLRARKSGWPKIISSHQGVHFLKRGFFRYAAALVLIAGMGTFAWLTRSKDRAAISTVLPSSSLVTVTEILPGSDKAVLTLSNGRKVQLSGQTKTIIDSGIEINNADGELTYGKSDLITYNTMTTPKGGQYKLSLPDGSKAWLNSASSIYYPTVFAGVERRVEITGEVYFEIEKNTSMPFRVIVNSPEGKTGEVEVLGTHFNVNAYPDEEKLSTTLLEGSVKVRNNNAEAVIVPGQQASMEPSGKIRTSQADIAQVLAWKHGLFQFSDASISTVMKQVARWYDVEVLYHGNVADDRFAGKIYRNTNLKDLLKILELSGARFTQEGKRIIVR